MLDLIKNSFIKLKSCFNRDYEHYLTLYLKINIILLFISLFLFNYVYNFSYLNISLLLEFLGIINIILIILNLKKISFDKIYIFLGLLVIFGIISTLFAENPLTSLYGYVNRYEGLFQLLYYYTVMFLAIFIHNDNNKFGLIKLIIFWGLVNSFICFLQVFDLLPFIPICSRGIVRGVGLITNSNFFGSFMLLCLGLSIGMFLFNDNGLKNIINLVLCIILYSGLLLSNALSSFVGCLFIVFLLIIYFIYLFLKKIFNTKIVEKFLILLLFLFVFNILLNMSGKSFLNNDILKFGHETSEIVKGNANDSYGTSRIFIWKNTLKVVPKYLLHGVGIDNFYYAFGDHPLFRVRSNGSFRYYDKAHNEYLQKLVCEGLASCVTYIAMLLLVFIKSIKKILLNSSAITVSLFLAFSSYCVQAFFNISVIEVAPMFFLVMGLLYDK